MASVVLAGALFWPASFRLCVTAQKYLFNKRLGDGDIYTIANRAVSALQAVIASVVGFFIIWSCTDILHDSHWLANAYCLFGLPYMLYDVWAMYLVYWHTRAHLHALSWKHVIIRFSRKHAVILVHHLVLPVIYVPLILWYRRGLGDFFIGCFYLMEVPVPFLSIRAILRQLKLEGTIVYAVNGIILIISFFLCRVALFFYLYWRYGVYVSQPTWRVPLLIPIKCTVGCLVLLSLQVYWWGQMVLIAKRTVSDMIKKSPSVSQQESH